MTAIVKGKPDNDPTERPISHEDLQQSNQRLREDFLLVFGIFASILIFLSIEVQVFQRATRFGDIVGISLFFLSALLLFVLTLQNIVKEQGAQWRDYNKPVVYLICACLVGATLCFTWTKVIKPVDNSNNEQKTIQTID